MAEGSCSDVAIVQPQLKFGPWQDKVVQGEVKTSFANPDYAASQCSTPIRPVDDPQFAGTTCLQIEHAAKSYHNYHHYMTRWSELARNGNGTQDLKIRPLGTGLIDENTTVTGSWIEFVDVAAASKKAGRIINNVTIAMPHVGLVKAARDPRNGIMQPEDLDGLGLYSIQASLPSPVVHVLCANMEREELAPIIYEAWPRLPGPVNMSSWPQQVDFKDLDSGHIKTTVDDLFHWGEQYDQKPPLFPKYPIEFNTILNNTSRHSRDAFYLLGRGGESHRDRYVLCSLRGGQTSSCSSRYNASRIGGTLESLCEHPDDGLAYIHSKPNATSGTTTISLDWLQIAREMGNALSLNTGVNDANASNSRLLTQLFLEEPELNVALPSPAEALAVLSSCTLLMAAKDAPFVDYWVSSSHYPRRGSLLTSFIE